MKGNRGKVHWYLSRKGTIYYFFSTKRKEIFVTGHNNEKQHMMIVMYKYKLIRKLLAKRLTKLEILAVKTGCFPTGTFTPPPPPSQLRATFEEHDKKHS
jgi:hypothetical protein